MPKTKPNKMPPVRVREDLYIDLVIIAGKLASERGRRVTLGDAIKEAKIALVEKRPDLLPEPTI